MISSSIIKISKLASKKIRAESIALDLTQEGFSNFIKIKYATYKNFEQKGKISFENFIQILIKLKKEELFLELMSKKRELQVIKMLTMKIQLKVHI